MAKFPTYEEMGKKIAEEALDRYIYKGKTLREWIDTLSNSESLNKCGHWEYTGTYDEDGMLECSICGREVDPSCYHYKFCPMCGAKMEESEVNNG